MAKRWKYDNGKKFKHRMRWNGANLDRMLLHRLDPPLDADLRGWLKDLKQEGIVLCDIKALLGPDASLFNQLQEQILNLYRSDAARAKTEQLDEGKFFDPEKKFKVRLLDRDVPADHPIMKLSLHPRLLSLVNSYMGMRSYLRTVDLWWDRPTPEGPMSTQLWHRDLDDARCIKAFIYFNDVDEKTGPFSYLRGTHMFGRFANLQPGNDGTKNRFTDAEITAPLSMDQAKLAVGPAGTLILCDTYGFHRGLKPEKDRLMSLFQYVSKASKYPRDFRLQGENHGLATVQRQALEPLIAELSDK